MGTYKAVLRPALEYASSVWSSIASSTSINKLQVMQNAALRTVTGCTQDTNIQHLHDETLTLPIHEHLQLHASQYKQKTQHPSHPLHKHTTYFNTPRLKKTIFNNGRYTTNIPTDPHTVTTTDIKTNMRHIHTSIVSRHLATWGNNKILRIPPPHTSSSEEILPRLTPHTLAQLRTNKSPFLKSYLHKVDAKTHPSPLCPLCNIHTHDTHHLFNFTHIRTTLSPLDLWTDPAGVTALLARWTEKLAGGPQAGTSDSPPLARVMGVGRQQQQTYDRFLPELLDKHAPLKKITVVDRPLNEWMTANILALKAIRWKNELIWRKTRITINFNIYYDSCMAVKKAISIRKAELIEQNVINCEGNQKKLFSLIHSLFGSKKITVLPEYTSSFTLASSIKMFFIEKMHNIKMEFPLLEACLPAYSFVDIDTIMPVCTAVFDTFQPLSCDVLAIIIHKLNRTTCGLDPFPTKLLMSHLSSIINIILRIVNLCFSSGDFPASCKSAIISPLIKKTGLDSEILKNYRPVANLSFISKIIEKAIATQIHSHLINNDIVYNFQSAYKTGHSCETASLRVYNDSVTTIGRGNGAMLVLLDLSAAFDTIDHDNLFCILEKYVGICGNALKLIKSYFLTVLNVFKLIMFCLILRILFVVFLKAQF